MDKQGFSFKTPIIFVQLMMHMWKQIERLSRGNLNVSDEIWFHRDIA